MSAISTALSAYFIYKQTRIEKNRIKNDKEINYYSYLYLTKKNSINMTISLKKIRNLELTSNFDNVLLIAEDDKKGYYTIDMTIRFSYKNIIPSKVLVTNCSLICDSQVIDNNSKVLKSFNFFYNLDNEYKDVIIYLK